MNIIYKLLINKYRVFGKKNSTKKTTVLLIVK